MFHAFRWESILQFYALHNLDQTFLNSKEPKNCSSLESPIPNDAALRLQEITLRIYKGSGSIHVSPCDYYRRGGITTPIIRQGAICNMLLSFPYFGKIQIAK